MYELYACWSLLPKFLDHAFTVRDLHSAQVVSLCSFIAISTGAVGCVFGGFVAERIGRIRLCICCSCTSGVCSAFVGSVGAALPLWMMLMMVLVWGFFVVPDSPQFSTMLTEVTQQELVGTALVMQQALGYLCTMPTIFMVPSLAAISPIGWTWSFAFLSPGAMVAVIALILLRLQPSSMQIGGGLK